MLGDLARAERLLTQSGKPRRGSSTGRGPWQRVLAAARPALLRHGRDFSLADEALAETFVQLDRVDLPIERGRTLLAEGQLRRRRREKVGARRALESAADLFARSGAVLWEQRAHDELDRVGRSRRSDQLSPTEAQVAALVAAGKTNRQVAAELFISTQTVKANLSRVFRTLDVQNRAELAARSGPPHQRSFVAKGRIDPASPRRHGGRHEPSIPSTATIDRRPPDHRWCRSHGDQLRHPDRFVAADLHVRSRRAPADRRRGADSPRREHANARRVHRRDERFVQHRLRGRRASHRRRSRSFPHGGCPDHDPAGRPLPVAYPSRTCPRHRRQRRDHLRHGR